MSEAILRVLRGLTDGINQGLEQRRKRQVKDEELRLKELEITERGKDRDLQRESNDLYRRALLRDRGEARIDDRDIKERQVAVQEGELKRKAKEDEGDAVLKAGEQLRKFDEQKQKVDKRLTLLESDLQSDPENPELNAQVKQLRTASDTLGKQMRTAEVIQAGAKKDILPYLDQFDHIDDPAQAKKVLENLLKSGRFDKNGPELRLLGNEYMKRFGR